MKANVANIRPVIMCGGAGSRLWPASRETMPKQFSDMFGERSTFQNALLRAADLGRPLVMTSVAQSHVATRQMTQTGVAGDILREPVRRDSGPAVAAACLTIAREDRGAIALVLPSDHVIRDREAFADAVARALPAAMDGRLVTFGVAATSPETGFGYVERGDALAPDVWSVARFHEKPCIAEASEYVARGMLWNAGMFLFKAEALIEEYRRFEASISAVEDAVRHMVGSSTGATLGAEYAAARAVSLDYAVMEKTDRAAVASLSCGWSDVGSWAAVWELGGGTATGTSRGARSSFSTAEGATSPARDHW